jgi:transcriptional regulator with XRE-family HTH domain
VNGLQFLISEQLQRLGISQARLAALAGCSSSFVNQVMKGKTTLPINRITSWADALSLTGAARSSFLVEALLAHSPPLIAAGWRSMAAALRCAGRADHVPAISDTDLLLMVAASAVGVEHADNRSYSQNRVADASNRMHYSADNNQSAESQAHDPAQEPIPDPRPGAAVPGTHAPAWNG